MTLAADLIAARALTKRTSIEAGDVFTVECPFVREYKRLPDDIGSDSSTWTWRPGVNGARAHGMGSVTYTVISTHALPSPYPRRVFFTRRWRAPDRREFGKSRLIIMTSGQFKRRLNGYVPGDGYIVEDLSDSERRAITAAQQSEQKHEPS